MAELWTLGQWEADCAQRRKQTVEEFRRWYRSMDMRPVACDSGEDCGHGNCHGWRLGWEDEYADAP